MTSPLSLRRALLLAGVVLSLSACAEKTGLSAEERLEIDLANSLQAALAYDEVCNKSEYVIGRNANLLGNLQMVPARAFIAVANNHHGADLEKMSENMLTMFVMTKDDTTAQLQKDGCQSAVADKAAHALAFFVTTKPEIAYAMTDKKLREMGITPAPRNPDLSR